MQRSGGVRRLAMPVLLLLHAGCAQPPPARARTSAPAGDAATQPPPDASLSDGTRACLASAPSAAVIRLVSSTPDCSGVGNLVHVFAVERWREGGPVPSRVYAICPLGERDDCLPGHAAGALYVVAVERRREPPREQQCVGLPMTEGRASCAVPVASVAEGELLLAATRP